VLLAGSAFVSTAIGAHTGKPLEPHDVWTAWSFEPVVVGSLLLSLFLYVRGVLRVWQQVAKDRGLRRWEVIAFVIGWLALVLALVSPVDAMGGVLFSAHMTQHEILMIIAAPLLVLGRPMAAFLWALPLVWRQRLMQASRILGWQRAWQILKHPATAWFLHAAVLWGWHVPMLFQATLTNEWVHAAQHSSFLVSALLFCESLVYGLNGRGGYGVAVLYVFTTAVHTSVLGALLTFANTLWYPAYRETTSAWGLTPLEDQQLGGLIMWVPAGMIYVGAGIIFLVLWLQEAERLSLLHERRWMATSKGYNK
jgi:putative membrane protein